MMEQSKTRQEELSVALDELLTNFDALITIGAKKVHFMNLASHLASLRLTFKDTITAEQDELIKAGIREAIKMAN